jgi:hypothetical protein
MARVYRMSKERSTATPLSGTAGGNCTNALESSLRNGSFLRPAKADSHPIQLKELESHDR